MRSLPGRRVDQFEPSAWLRDRFNTIDQHYHTDGYQHCQHYSPQGIGFITLRFGDIIMCQECVPALIRATEDVGTLHQCDRCDTTADSVHMHLMDVGNLIVFFNLCPDCCRREIGP